MTVATIGVLLLAVMVSARGFYLSFQAVRRLFNRGDRHSSYVWNRFVVLVVQIVLTEVAAVITRNPARLPLMSGALFLGLAWSIPDVLLKRDFAGIVPKIVEFEGGGLQPPFGITGMHSKGGNRHLCHPTTGSKPGTSRRLRV